MRLDLTTQLRRLDLREIRSEFNRIFTLVGRMIEANREAGHEIYAMYVDESTGELVIEHEGGEKRIT